MAKLKFLRTNKQTNGEKKKSPRSIDAGAKKVKVPTAAI